MSSLNIDLQKIDNKLGMKVDMNSSVFQRILEANCGSLYIGGTGDMFL